MRRKSVKTASKCVKNARNTFGGEHLLDDTDHLTSINLDDSEVFLLKFSHSRGTWLTLAKSLLIGILS